MATQGKSMEAFAREHRGGDAIPPVQQTREAGKVRYLRIALVLVGLIFIVGIYPLTVVWPSGWSCTRAIRIICR